MTFIKHMLKTKIKLMVMMVSALSLVLMTSNVYSVEISNELKEKITSYIQEREAIRSELQKVVQANADATRKEKHEAVAEWRKENEERLSTEKALGAEIRKEVKNLIREKKKELKHLSPEERNIAMKAWFKDNKECLLLVQNGPNPMEAAKKRFNANAQNMNRMKYMDNIERPETPQRDRGRDRDRDHDHGQPPKNKGPKNKSK